MTKISKSPIREIIDKYRVLPENEKGELVLSQRVIEEEDFDKLEKELASLMFIKTMDREVLKLMLMGVDALKEGVITLMHKEETTENIERDGNADSE